MPMAMATTFQRMLCCLLRCQCLQVGREPSPFATTTILQNVVYAAEAFKSCAQRLQPLMTLPRWRWMPTALL